MLNLTRTPRFHAGTPEEHRAKKAQTRFFDNKTQEEKTLELRDITVTTRSDGKELTMSKWRMYSGDEHEDYAIKLGNTIVIGDIVLSFRDVTKRGDACIAVMPHDWVDVERGDAGGL